jgi:hypothetical protein
MRRALSFLVVLTVLLVLAVPTGRSQDFRDLPNLPGAFHPYNATGPFAGRFHCLVTEHDLDPAVLLFVRGVDGTLKDGDLRVASKEQLEQLKPLLVRLENLAEKNPATRVETYVIFYGGGLPNVVLNDDERDKLDKDLKALALELRKSADEANPEAGKSREEAEKKAEEQWKLAEEQWQKSEEKNPEEKRRIDEERKKAENRKLRHVVLALASRNLPEESKADADPKLKKAVPLGKQYNLGDDNEATVILYKRLRVYARYDLGKGKLDEEAAKRIGDEVKTKLGARRE